MHRSLARRLRVLRAERGLTVRQVAELSGVAKETISQVERGERHPYDRTLAKLAKAYEVPVEDLLEEPVLASPKAQAPHEPGPTGEASERPFPSLNQVREMFAPLADGLNHYCARWEERLPNLQGTREEVADFVANDQDFRAMISAVYEDEFRAIALALGLGTRYSESGLPRDVVAGFIRAETEEHSLMHRALQRYYAVGKALAESIKDKKEAERMRQVLSPSGV